MILFLIATACVENHIIPFGNEDDSEIITESEWEDDAPDGNENGEESTDDNDENLESDPEEPTTSEDEEDDDAPRPGSSEDHPKVPRSGDIIVNEVMIDPESVLDKNGEWVEFLNTTNDWLDMRGMRLADQGVDDIEIEASETDSLLIPPKGFAVICANDSFWNNGGVDCDGTFHYQTFGGGFGLSNSEDEVALLSDDGELIDYIAYGAGFTPTGVSMGLDPRDADATANNYGDNWCEQFSFMPQGDSGSPGSENSWCF